jgi:ribosomal protein S18 acetylase RimI-like enzyme
MTSRLTASPQAHDASPPDRIDIRPARQADLATVLEIWRDASLAASEHDRVEVVAALLEHRASSLLVAELDGAIVGTLIAGFDGWRGHLYRLAVLERCRRRGIGHALVAEGERFLRAHGARRGAAAVLLGKPEAVAFWVAAGYVQRPASGRFTKAL